MVVHDLGSERRDRLLDGRLVTQVDPMHLRCRIHIGLVASAEVVENGYLMARRDVCVDNVGTDETGTARHQNPHCA
jgi:hypothetical protein